MGKKRRRELSFQGGIISLTEQEWTIAKLVADGNRNDEIAERLVISVKTVEAHLQNLREKLKLHSRGMAGRVIIARLVWESQRPLRYQNVTRPNMRRTAQTESVIPVS